MLNETYISVDIETSGTLPGESDILSIGAVPIIEGEVLENEGINIFINPFDGIRWSESTLEWWRAQDSFTSFINSVQMRGEPEHISYPRFEVWLEKYLPFSFVADPACFDIAFLNIGMNCFFKTPRKFFPRLRAVDIRTLRMAHLKTDYGKAQRDLIEKINGVPEINHNALTDAINQAYHFVYLCKKLSGKEN